MIRSPPGPAGTAPGVVWEQAIDSSEIAKRAETLLVSTVSSDIGTLISAGIRPASSRSVHSLSGALSAIFGVPARLLPAGDQWLPERFPIASHPQEQQRALRRNSWSRPTGTC